jgi:hypothetical protein
MAVPDDMNAGPQPLSEIMDRLGLTNHDLVAGDVSATLTHKVAGKARKGRKLTARMQQKVAAALNVCLAARGEPPLPLESLFTYRGR